MRLRRPSAIVALVILTTAVLISRSGCATRLLVVSQFDEILRYNGDTGAFIDVFVTSVNVGSALTSLVFGPDRNLYVTGVTAGPSKTDVGQVRRYDGTTGALIDVSVAPGSGGLIHPSGLTFGPVIPRPVTKQMDTLLIASAPQSDIKKMRGRTSSSAVQSQ
jgi:hypothetical protein